jgi:hypothetical protein
MLSSASYQQLMFHIDDHVGIAIAGLTSDARVLLPSFYISPTHRPKRSHLKMKQVYAPAGHGIHDSLQPARPVNRLVSVIADSVFRLFFPNSRFFFVATDVCIDQPHRGPSGHTGIWPTSIWCRRPGHRARPHWTTHIQVLTKRLAK